MEDMGPVGVGQRVGPGLNGQGLGFGVQGLMKDCSDEIWT